MSIKDIDEKAEIGYNESLGNPSRVRVMSPIEETPTMVMRNNNNNIINNNNNAIKAMYMECLKNHAISQGGHALDGCCEFLPIGPEGSLDALKCAACNCHRNFHRKEAPLPPNDVSVVSLVPATDISAVDVYPPYNHHRHQVSLPPQHTMYRASKGLLHMTAPPSGGGGSSALALISPSGGGSGLEDHDDATDTDNGGIGSSSNSKKRFRTRFTPEQKKKMKAFADRLNWKIHKQDDVVVQEFCNENNVKRQVLKVWVHNNKHTIGKKP